MSMMARRGAATAERGTGGGHGHEAPGAAPGAAGLRFPETPNVVPAIVPVAEVRARLEALTAQRFTGYFAIDRKAGHAAGAILLQEGQPIKAALGDARSLADSGDAALGQLLAPDGGVEALCAAHPLPDSAVLALVATFQPPQLTQALGSDVGEVALLLRDLAGIRHSGAVQISAAGPGARGAGRGPSPAAAWVRILMYEGKFLGVYSAADRQLKASLADVSEVMAEGAPQLTLFATGATPTPLALPDPSRAREAAGSFAGPGASGATAERDDMIETDLVWFLSRFERAFGRLKERRDPEADILRAFAELTNELASFVAALAGGAAGATAAPDVIAMELARARAAGAVGVEYKLGKGGIDPGALGKAYQAYGRHAPEAGAYFRDASAGLLILIERMLERMLGAFYDATAAGFAREGCEALLREVRGGLAPLAVASGERA